MTIEKRSEETQLVISLEGRLDTTTAPALEAELKQSLDECREVVEKRTPYYISQKSIIIQPYKETAI